MLYASGPCERTLRSLSRDVFPNVKSTVNALFEMTGISLVKRCSESIFRDEAK